MTVPQQADATDSGLLRQNGVLDLPRVADETINDFFVEYYELLTRSAQRRLGGFPQVLYDADDVVSSAFLSLLRLAREGTEDQVADRSELLRLLFAIARNKVAAAVRRESTQKRQRGTATPLDDVDPAAPQPGPEHIVMMRELFNSLVAQLNAELRPVAELKLQGLTNDEIARKLQVQSRTVERKLASIRELCRVIFR